MPRSLDILGNLDDLFDLDGLYALLGQDDFQYMGDLRDLNDLVTRTLSSSRIDILSDARSPKIRRPPKLSKSPR